MAWGLRFRVGLANQNLKPRTINPRPFSMNKEIGICPICNRMMIEGPSVDKHHFVPKSEGGVDTVFIHRVCHSKIHSLFTEKELAEEYNTPENTNRD